MTEEFFKKGFQVAVVTEGRRGSLCYRAVGEDGGFRILAELFWEDGARTSAISDRVFSTPGDALRAAGLLAKNRVTPMTLDEALVTVFNPQYLQ